MIEPPQDRLPFQLPLRPRLHLPSATSVVLKRKVVWINSAADDAAQKGKNQTLDAELVTGVAGDADGSKAPMI